LPANGTLGSCAANPSILGQVFLAHGKSCSLACNNGYDSGSSATGYTCSFGSLTAGAMTCSSKQCPPLAPGTLATRNATVGTCADIETNYRPHLSVCDLDCASGYTRTAGQTTCLLGNFTLQTRTPTSCPYTNGANVSSSTCPASIPSGSKQRVGGVGEGVRGEGRRCNGPCDRGSPSTQIAQPQCLTCLHGFSSLPVQHALCQSRGTFHSLHRPPSSSSPSPSPSPSPSARLASLSHGGWALG
jgi:hypothetical protein